MKKIVAVFKAERVVTEGYMLLHSWFSYGLGVFIGWLMFK